MSIFSGGSTLKKNLLPDEVDYHCQETEDIRITDLLEEIQILKEELRSKNQEIEHSQSFVEKYKKLRLKVMGDICICKQLTPT